MQRAAAEGVWALRAAATEAGMLSAKRCQEAPAAQHAAPSKRWPATWCSQGRSCTCAASFAACPPLGSTGWGRLAAPLRPSCGGKAAMGLRMASWHCSASKRTVPRRLACTRQLLVKTTTRSVPATWRCRQRRQWQGRWWLVRAPGGGPRDGLRQEGARQVGRVGSARQRVAGAEVGAALAGGRPHSPCRSLGAAGAVLAGAAGNREGAKARRLGLARRSGPELWRGVPTIRA